MVSDDQKKCRLGPCSFIFENISLHRKSFYTHEMWTMFHFQAVQFGVTLIRDLKSKACFTMKMSALSFGTKLCNVQWTSLEVFLVFDCRQSDSQIDAEVTKNHMGKILGNRSKMLWGINSTAK